jgi:F-type H+-transporting ATPase subunit b
MTLPLLLAAATPTAEATAAARGQHLKQTFVHFGVEPKYLIMQVVSFLIVLGSCCTISASSPSRRRWSSAIRKIEAGIKDAEEMHGEIGGRTAVESAAIVKKANAEATRIVEDARKTAKDYPGSPDSRGQTVKANDLLVTKAQQAIELEHKKMLADARSEVARLVVTTTERVLAKKAYRWLIASSYNEAAALANSPASELASV